MTATAISQASSQTGDLDDADDFRPVQGPSLASIHRQWLDAGLPAHTWLTYLARWRETQAPEVPHTHIGQCNPACRRWGA